MSDIELLHRIAQVAGIQYYATKDDGTKCIYEGRLEWNPLIDDGDRYRLAKAMGLRIDFAGNEVFWHGACGLNVLRWPEDDDEAHCIVRAAAEIGMTL